MRGPLHKPDASIRFNAYRDALKDNGIAISNDLVINSTFDAISGRDAVSILLERRIHFDTIMCSNDHAALAAMDRLSVQGFSVPEDVAVTGYDNVSESSNNPIPITTINQPLERLGYESIVLMRHLLNGTSPEICNPIKSTVIYRKSSCRRKVLPKHDEPADNSGDIKEQLDHVFLNNLPKDCSCELSEELIVFGKEKSDPESFYLNVLNKYYVFLSHNIGALEHI